MKGDFTRLSFDPEKHYRGVLMQQGRAQLDSDWNEQVQIAEHRYSTFFGDFVGQSGAPAAGGMEFLQGNTGAIHLSSGRYYVDGLLVERKEDQPLPDLTKGDGLYLAYLDVWTSHVTTAEDDSLREPALGGPDTTTRIKTESRLRCEPIEEDLEQARIRYYQNWPKADVAKYDWERRLSSGTLSVNTSSVQTRDNRLFRLEIHDSGRAGAATFKWSRDNGAVVARVRQITGNQMILERPDPATTDAFRGAQYVEVTDEARMERGEPGVMVSLQRTFVENDSLYAENDLPAFGVGVTVRRWDSTASKIKSGNTNLGSDMIVRFGNTQAFYRGGDYWLIPVRAGIVLDWVGGSPQPPHGTEHHFAALALIRKQGDQLALVDNLQTKFQPLISGNVSKMGDTINGDLCVLGRVGIGTITPGQAYKLDINGNTNTSGYAMIQSTKTDVVTTSGAGDLTVLLGHFEVGSSIKIEFQAKGGNAQVGAEYVLNGPWSGLPIVSVLADQLIGSRLTFYAKKEGSPLFGHIWLAATWINMTENKSDSNTLRFRITSSADFDTAYTVPFSNEYIQLTTFGLVNINGKVGIGTTSPNAQLQIARSVTVGPFTRAAPGDESIGRFEVTGGQAQIGFTRQSLPARPQSFAAGDQYWWYNPDGTARLWTDGKGDLLTITKDGKLGIGTNNPEAKLHIEIKADDTNTNLLEVRKNSYKYLSIENNGDVVVGQVSGTKLEVLRDAHMMGWVGIGTTEPKGRLHIKAPEAGQVPLMVETPAGDLSDLTARYAFFKGQLEQPAIPNGTICLGGVYGDKLVFFFRAPNGVAGVAAMKGGNNLTEVLARLG